MSDTKQIHQELTRFVHKLESLQETLPSLMIMAYINRRKTNAKRLKFLEENGELIEESENKKEYALKIEHQRLAERLYKKYERASTAYEVLPSKFLVSFVSEYDAFLGNLLKIFFRLKPEILDGSERNISFSELKEIGSVEEAYEHILEKEVEAVLRKSHSEQFDWLESKFSMPLRKGLDSWSKFIEITERRNLFVHCDGVVSSQYISVCRRHNVVHEEEIKVGSKLDTSKNYLTQAYQCLFEIGTKLTYVLWRKLFPDDLDASDTSLINVSYSLIHEEDYVLAKRILDFSTCTLKKWGTDSNRRIFIINRAQVYYHSKEFDECNKILEKEDWSSCGDNYKICVAALRKDYEQAITLMKRIGNAGSISEADYMDWPVFRDFRTTEDFKNTFLMIFKKEPVNISELVKEPDIEEVLAADDEEFEKELLEKISNKANSADAP